MAFVNNSWRHLSATAWGSTGWGPGVDRERRYPAWLAPVHFYALAAYIAITDLTSDAMLIDAADQADRDIADVADLVDLDHAIHERASLASQRIAARLLMVTIRLHRAAPPNDQLARLTMCRVLE